ncbi:TrmH family RNA methyltransferase [Natronoglycomyces albus]|uniref:RNA methyltransferase n=1 Tax=Natronoglycomyces albus TaxID=2811108 RepID=A0A895XMA6_9ACTN|nr:RNA methyltransferase [Natronoglycomyces albus]QSB04125.1 RNA methyltransferase [Natronoglycomyces albus]
MTATQPGQKLTTRSARVVSARKLNRRRNRDKVRRFLAEGPQSVAEAAIAGAIIDLYYTESAAERFTDIIASAERSGAYTHVVEDEVLEALADTVTPQGLIAECRYLEDHVPADARLVVVCDRIADPGNAGTILRAADAAGADAVVFPEESVDPYNGKCVRASAGSLFHLPVVRGGVTAEHVATMSDLGAQVFAADAGGDADVFELAAAGDLVGPIVWLFGSEPHGLDSELASIAHRKVRVPIWGQAESLNLAVAAGVCLYVTASSQRNAAQE